MKKAGFLGGCGKVLPSGGKCARGRIWWIDDCSVVNGMVQVCLDRKKVAEKLDKVLAKIQGNAIFYRVVWL